jgi:hypothetical protein
MSRFHDSAGALRPATPFLAGVAVAAIAVAVMAASPSLSAAPAASSAPTPTPTAAVSAAPDPTPVPTAVATPVATPVTTPRPDSTPASSPSPDEGGLDAMPIAVELDTFDGHRVSIDIVDRTGSIVSAVSGRLGDNPSADGLAVTNVDARTLQLTWVDFPIDNRLALFVDDVDGHLRLLLIQPGPTVVTDAIGFDRQLVLTFDHAVNASTVETIIQEGMDTPG